MSKNKSLKKAKREILLYVNDKNTPYNIIGNEIIILIHSDLFCPMCKEVVITNASYIENMNTGEFDCVISCYDKKVIIIGVNEKSRFMENNGVINQG